MNEPLSASQPAGPQFLFMTCQQGAETALKAEVARLQPTWLPAFSRPGFVTYKLPPDEVWSPDRNIHCVFARAFGVGLGNISGATPAERAAAVWQRAGLGKHAVVHVFPRDSSKPNRHDYTPDLTPGTAEAVEALISEHARRAAESPAELLPQFQQESHRDQRVLDVILLDDTHWFLGEHIHGPGHLPWPGGLASTELPPHAVSRAYLKLHQALTWSRLAMKSPDVVCELGSSPGGAAQLLLERGQRVLGVDPAEMAPVVMEHPRFRHVQRRTPTVKRVLFNPVRWVLADMNVAPQYTLDAVEEIVKLPGSKVRGILLTIKLLQWELAAEIPAYFERVRSWGFTRVRARQLQQHRQEFVLCAERPPKKPPKKKKLDS